MYGLNLLVLTQHLYRVVLHCYQLLQLAPNLLIIISTLLPQHPHCSALQYVVGLLVLAEILLPKRIDVLYNSSAFGYERLVDSEVVVDDRSFVHHYHQRHEQDDHVHNVEG